MYSVSSIWLHTGQLKPEIFLMFFSFKETEHPQWHLIVQYMNKSPFYILGCWNSLSMYLAAGTACKHIIGERGIEIKASYQAWTHRNR